MLEGTIMTASKEKQKANHLSSFYNMIHMLIKFRVVQKHAHRKGKAHWILHYLPHQYFGVLSQSLKMNWLGELESPHIQCPHHQTQNQHHRHQSHRWYHQVVQERFAHQAIYTCWCLGQPDSWTKFPYEPESVLSGQNHNFLPRGCLQESLPDWEQWELLKSVKATMMTLLQTLMIRNQLNFSLAITTLTPICLWMVFHAHGMNLVLPPLKRLRWLARRQVF